MRVKGSSSKHGLVTHREVQALAEKFWSGLNEIDRVMLGDELVLEGTPDWREYLDRKPPCGFWDAVDRLRMLDES